MKYLVTGGAGFIGSHLVSYLATMGHQVGVLDDLSSGHIDNLPRQADLVIANVCDPDAVMRATSGCDGIFHLAAVTSVAQSVENCVDTHRVNQSATVAILDAARRRGNLPIVFASSAAIYGEQCPAMEHLSPAPRSAYGADKAGSELHLQAGWWSFGQPSAAMRFFNVFGPWQDPASPYSGVISVFLSRALASLPLIIHGDGLQSRDFIFVEDVVRFLSPAMDRLHQRPTHFACNVCTGKATTIRRLAEMVAMIAGSPPRIVHGAIRTGDIRHSRGDSQLATRLLRVKAEIDLDAGLSATMQWIKARALRAAS